MKKTLEVQQFLSHKREKIRLKKITLERQRRKDYVQRRSSPLRYLPRTLTILQKNLPPELVNRRGNKSELIKIPSTFSIVEQTEESLRTIYKLVSYSTRPRPPAEIFFDHSSLKHFDLAAEVILDIVALELRQARRRQKRKTNFRGRLPADVSANRFIRAVGITDRLNLIQYKLPRSVEKDVRILKFMSYKQLLRLYEESPSERAARRLVEFVNNCLSTSGIELTDFGRHSLGQYAGEVLDNATQHSGTDDWVLVGYLDLSSPEKICEISIFNFGKSYAETFIDLPPGHFTRQQIEPFVALHAGRGFFRAGWEADNLLTVVALQGQISSKNEKSNDTRGNGTIELIKFFQDVHDATPLASTVPAKMAIVSGRTHILFDGKHSMVPDSNGREIIAFNTTNSLKQPPDRSHVKCLSGVEFPGTIVSVRFPLSEEATQEVRKENDL